MPSAGIGISVALWLVVVTGGTVLMAVYSNVPGTESAAPALWPQESAIQLEPNRWTLVMFAHPRCPCTRASLSELERLLAQVPAQPSTHVVFLKPPGTPPDWERSDLWSKAASIRGVAVYVDNLGIETERFHVETSGQVLLYSPDGKLKFEGGITKARGHEGDNAGRSALAELLRGSLWEQNQTPVFGCSLLTGGPSKPDTSCQR